MHYEKFKANMVVKELKHDSRETNIKVNENIDRERTKQNYDLMNRPNPYEYYKERLGQVKVQKRDDVNTLCSWIVTLPKQDFTEEEQQKFFKVAFEEFCKRYGKENCISAYVHNDEAGQPHMHFKFIPVVKDKKRPERYKVSAFECVKRNDLKKIHIDFQKLMAKEFGRPIDILNGATVGGNKTIAELKLQGTQEELEAKQLQLFEADRKISRAGKVIDSETLPKINTKESLLTKFLYKDYALVDKQTIKDMAQTVNYYKSPEEAEKQLQRRESQVKAKEQELTQKTHILNEDKKAFKHILETFEVPERTIDERLKAIDGIERSKTMEAFIENKGLTAEYNAFLCEIANRQLRERAKHKSREITRRYDDMEL